MALLVVSPRPAGHELRYTCRGCRHVDHGCRRPGNGYRYVPRDRQRRRYVCRAQEEEKAGDGEEKGRDALEDLLPVLDPERQQRLMAALDRVDRLQKRREELELQSLEGAKREMLEKEIRAKEAQQVVLEKEAELEKIQAQARVRAAERELLQATLNQSKWAAAVNEDLEKLESAKAAAIAAVGGTAGSVPYLLTSGHSPLSTFLSAGVILLSAFLFGVTYRYALRQDMGNLQLKSGVVAAFGLVRGLAVADVLQNNAAETGSAIFTASTISQGAIAAGEAMLTFGFAAAALEFAFARGFLKPFGDASNI